jgi:hypothetical protein
MGKDSSKEIEQCRREDVARFRHNPTDPDKLKERKQLKQYYRNILKTMEWGDLVNALGLRPGTKAYCDHYEIWQAYLDSRPAGEQKRRGLRKP